MKVYKSTNLDKAIDKLLGLPSPQCLFAFAYYQCGEYKINAIFNKGQRNYWQHWILDTDFFEGCIDARIESV